MTELNVLFSGKSQHYHSDNLLFTFVNRQDLNCSVMTGTDRVFHHTTFTELQWRRDPFSQNLFILSPGFRKRSHLFSEEFIDILKDIHALQCMRDSPDFVCEDTARMIHVDNQQASIQSRLVGLPKLSLLLECCYLAAYMSACQLCCKVWRASVMPVSELHGLHSQVGDACLFPTQIHENDMLTRNGKSHVSLQLLCKLQQADDNGVWDEHPDLLIWLLYTGGAFVSTSSTRLEYVALMNKIYTSRFGDLYSSRTDVLGVLKQFVWSEKAFAAQIKNFWEDNYL
jgi:hypothetical protein